MGRFYRWIRGFLREASNREIPVYAANACFFLILSLFPMLLLVLGVLRYTPLEAEALLRLVEGMLPGAFRQFARRLIRLTWENVSGGALSLTALTALWSAGRGILGIMTGLNAAYGTAETRGYVARRLMCLLYVALFLLVLLLTLSLHVFGRAVVRLLSRLPGLAALVRLADLRFFLLLPLQAGVFTAMFMVLPNGKNRFRESLPGALLASCGWLIFSDLYSVYVDKFARLTNVFGSVYALALAMLWLYCCMTIVLWGGMLNRFLTNL